MKLRTSAKAVILHEGRVLLTRCVDATGEWYCCPGGGQQPGETLAQAVRRECLEETGAIVGVGDMFCVLEWHDMPNATHSVESYFLCTLQPGSNIGNGAEPDSMQIGVDWIPAAEIRGIDLRPGELKPLIADMPGFRYLGLVGGIRIRSA
jgi:ADP-ribose pyrophosphatase YjhB (NUDIX family)